MNSYLPQRVPDTVPQISEHASNTVDHTRFLSSHNPAQVKRNVLASFTDVLLLPVTIVPKTVGKTVGAVGAAAGAAGSAAVQGLQMLNPQRWAGGNTATAGYSQRFDAGDMLFEIGGDDEDDESAPAPTRQSLMEEREIALEQCTRSTMDLLLTSLICILLQLRILHCSLLLQRQRFPGERWICSCPLMWRWNSFTRTESLSNV
jgi:hypothetical protein